MTEKQIIKVLECCKNGFCLECPMLSNDMGAVACMRKLISESFDLIKRKDEQIEGLIAGQETLQKYIAEKDVVIKRLEKRHRLNLLEQLDIAEKIKSEAVKEFAERLKEKAFTHERPFEANEDKFIKFVAVESIDNLVKEMVGEK